MYDAIVIGARCAGSPTAMLLARHHFEEIWNQGKLDLIDTYFAPDFLNFGHPCPPERVRQIVLAWRTAFPDLQFTIEEQIVEADQVFSRCTCSGTHLGPFVHPLVGSLPPTGKRFAVQQMHLTRLRDGLLVEHWAVRDDLAMLQQLGMVFMPEEANEVHQEREQREAMDFTLTEEQADMEMEIEVARTMYYKAAWLQMQGKP